MKSVTPAAVISTVASGSLAAELGLEAGDRLLKINGQTVTDLIDYQLAESTEQLCLTVEKPDGRYWEIELQKEQDQGLGITFTSAVFDRIKTCCNQCLFCFVDQMPPGQRCSLYIKDDDYRLSFLQGSYITLTNLTTADWQRIQRLRLSPLYISVHATDPEVRSMLLGHKHAGNILAALERLTSWGCQIHAQAVLCPGLNDGEILEKTIADLGKFWPNLQSLAIVPVGLTKHRAKLPFLRKFYPEEAAAVLRTVHQAQSDFFSRHGSRLVFAADEFYLQAQADFPPLAVYEDLFQLENGVGLWPLFKTQFETELKALSSNYNGQPRSFTVVTGVDAARLWEELRRQLSRAAPALDLSILPVTNHFFGAEVTVTGLLTGRDILAALHEKQPAAETCLLLPRICLRQEEAVFLDGLTLDNFCAATHLPVRVLNINGAEVVRTLLGLEEA